MEAEVQVRVSGPTACADACGEHHQEAIRACLTVGVCLGVAMTWHKDSFVRAQVAQGLRAAAERMEKGEFEHSVLKFFVEQMKVLGMTDEIAADPELVNKHLDDPTNRVRREAVITIDCSELNGWNV